MRESEPAALDDRVHQSCAERSKSQLVLSPSRGVLSSTHRYSYSNKISVVYLRLHKGMAEYKEIHIVAASKCVINYPIMDAAITPHLTLIPAGHRTYNYNQTRYKIRHHNKGVMNTQLKCNAQGKTFSPARSLTSFSNYTLPYEASFYNTAHSRITGICFSLLPNVIITTRGPTYARPPKSGVRSR